MHSISDQNLMAGASPATLLAVDRALRAAREAAFSAGSLSEPLWTLLVGLADHGAGLSFETLDSGPASHLGRPHLLRCLSLLEDRELIEACGHGPAPLLSHVRLTGKGRATIDAVLAEALAQLQGRLTHLPLLRRDFA